MTRIPTLVLMGLASLAAAPNRSDFNTVTLLDQPTVAAPQFASRLAAEPPPSAYAPAPVPNTEAAAPLVRDPRAGQPELQANLFTNRHSYRGEGYLPGSTVQGSQDVRIRPAPGFSLKLPLE